MNQQEWLENDSELVLAYIRKLRIEFKEEPSLATVVNGAMIRAEHAGVLSQAGRAPAGKIGSGPATNTDGWGEKPLMCPECKGTVNPQISKGTGKPYYKCPTCSERDSAVFINMDGTARRVTGDRRQ